jgi:hypothetical protein
LLHEHPQPVYADATPSLRVPDQCRPRRVRDHVGDDDSGGQTVQVELSPASGSDSPIQVGFTTRRLPPARDTSRPSPYEFCKAGAADPGDDGVLSECWVLIKHPRCQGTQQLLAALRSPSSGDDCPSSESRQSGSDPRQAGATLVGIETGLGLRVEALIGDGDGDRGQS